MDYKHYELLYNTEKEKGLRMCFRLTEGHLHPNNWQKMTVSKAAQLFSRHVGMAFKHYRNLPGTASVFMRNINLSF